MSDDLCSFSCLVGSYDMIDYEMGSNESYMSYRRPKKPAEKNNSSAENISNNNNDSSNSSSDDSCGLINGMSGIRSNINSSTSKIKNCRQKCSEKINEKYNEKRDKYMETYNFFRYPDMEKYKQEYSRNAFLRQIVASSLGTCVSVLTLNPISVVKLRLQRQVRYDYCGWAGGRKG